MKQIGIGAILGAGVLAVAMVAGAAQVSEGMFSAAQAKRGAAVFAVNCAGCHGADLEGASASALTGPDNMKRWAGQTAADLHARVRTMPYGSPGTLKDQDYMDATAFLLEKNGLAPGKKDLTASTAAKVQIAAASEAVKPKHRLTVVRDTSAAIAAGPTQAELTAAGAKTTDWLFTNHDYSGQRFVDLKQLDKNNVSKLRPVCMYQVGDLNPFEANPLIYRGAMFITTKDTAISLDAATCRLNWRYDRTSRTPASYGLKMHRGAALKDGKLIYGTPDGYLIALDAGSGKVIWEREVTNPLKTGGGFTMAPMIFEDLIIVGPAGSELGVKGWIGAFKISNGDIVWRFNTVPNKGEPGADTWPNDKAREEGGGAVWGSMTLDTGTGRIYVPVSNPTPDFEGHLRVGDNLFTCAMIVLDVRTGKLLWYHQITPHDTHDYDLSQASPQFTSVIDGKPRKMVVAVGKEGLLHAFDREAREVVYKVSVTTRQNTDKEWIAIDKTANGERVCPGAIGGVQWNGPAFSPVTNALYVPAVDWCSMTRDPPEQSRGWLTAIDAASGKVRWQYQSQRPMLAAVTATSSNLLFTGEVTGDLLALDANDGKVLYRFNTGGPMIGGVVTYQMDRKQYVAAVSGGTNAFWRTQPGSATVVVLAIP
ncbi:MAG: PQQ-binding-like beta-propeller repeat protein [Rhodospirillaceae bacterium]|nr:PQQ-binding-like beta-propeller repeat protein [Rhodospirillaceae bacterium]